MTLAELKALAEKAPKGPWTAKRGLRKSGFKKIHDLEEMLRIKQANGETIMALFKEYIDTVGPFVVAANPEIILELVARIEGLSEALEFYKEWEDKTSNEWSKTYQRTVLSVDYPGESKAGKALFQFGPDKELK